MNSHRLLCLALVCAGILFGGCATARHPAVTNVPAAGQSLEIHMFDSRHGWAQTRDELGDLVRVLRTTNGGRTWREVTPHYSTNRVWDCQFPKPQMAWLSYYDGGKTHLLLTTNGGQAWAPWNPWGSFPNDTHNFFLVTRNCRFFNAREGIVEMTDYGLGSASYNYFDTHDGGRHWQPIPLASPEGYFQGPGTLQISDPGSSYYGGGINYYPPGRVFIVDGDFMDGTPAGSFGLSTSTNYGKSWRHLTLPLPDHYRTWWAGPNPPFFTDTHYGLLSVDVFQRDTNYHHTASARIFYGTSDGGTIWTARPGIAEGISGLPEDDQRLDQVSASLIFACAGPNLLVTHDGARTWQTIRPNIDLGRSNSDRDVLQLDFVDARHGWVVIYDHSDHAPASNYFLYKTTDGGATWAELPLKIEQ